MTNFRTISIAIVALMFSMERQSVAQSGIDSLESGRLQSVEGQILDDQIAGQVIIRPQNTRPGTEQEYSFSQHTLFTYRS